jgi:putative CocE/NonD family hydrolase
MKIPGLRSTTASVAFVLSAAAAPLLGQGPAKVTPDMVQTGSDIPADWKQPQDNFDYVERDVMIPMRDGVKLHTVIVIPKGAHDLPMLLERTPYNTSSFVPNNSPLMADAVWSGDKDWADGSYILVWQDVRGKYGSEGDYVMTRPPMGPLNPTKTDDTTDAWDTIDWLVKNVKESSGKVGMIGSSYDGWTVVMALLDPHPALKVAAPESPMIDGWMGDDWYHYGALRQVNLDYFSEQTTKRGEGQAIPRENYDDYTNFLEAGSAGAYAEANGFRQLPWWNRFAAHPAYDAFWQLQALDALVAQHPSAVPTMWLQGLWDQEDIYGAVHAWEALEQAGHGANNHLVIGPWWHSQINRDGWSLGPLKWPGNTTAAFRQQVMIPWFNHFLRDTPLANPLPKAMIYNPVETRWDSFSGWKVASAQQLTPLYLHANMGLGFQPPVAGSDSYVSDPARPVPYLPRPIPQQNDRIRRRLRGQVDRCLSRHGPDRSCDGWLRVARVARHLPWTLPAQLLGPLADPHESGAGIQVPPADSELRLQAGPSDHGADPVEPVSALRPEPADLRAQHPLRQAVRLPQGDGDDRAWTRCAERHPAAGRAGHEHRPLRMVLPGRQRSVF